MMNIEFNPAYVGARNDIIKFVPNSAKMVLDVGCSNGRLGADLKMLLNASVVGIEISETMAAHAKEKLDYVYVGDVSDVLTNGRLNSYRFDTIIFADVLEHLADPWAALAACVNLLEKDGVVIASIPNVRHIDTIYNLIFKNYWPYRDRGIHDKTHLRFFTRKNVLELFKQAGYQAQIVDVNYRIIEHPHKLNRIAKYFAMPGLKDFFAFKFVVTAHK